MSHKLIHGIDLTQINRPEFTHPDIAHRILSSQELIDFNNTDNKIKFIAVHWAIKEAIIKAISPHIIDLKSINISKRDNRYVWTNHPAWIKQFVISTSDEQDVIIASVFGVCIN